MNENAPLRPAMEGFLDRWALMEEGRKLHDRAVFELFARCFARLGLGQRNRRQPSRPRRLTPTLATPHTP